MNAYQPETRRALLVSHGGVTVDLLRTLFGDYVVQAAAPEAIERRLPACGITRLEWREDDWELAGVADVAYLSD